MMRMDATRRSRYGYYLACFGGLELLHFWHLGTLGLFSLLAPLLVLLALMLLGRLAWSRVEPLPQQVSSIAREQAACFSREFLIYAVVALLALLLFRELWQVPLALALADALLILLLGGFAAAEHSLRMARQWYEQGVQQQIKPFRLVPVSTVLQRLIVIVSTAFLLVAMLALFRLQQGMAGAEVEVGRLIWGMALEILVLFLLMAFLLLRISRHYASNLHYVFESQFRVLRDIQAGDYSQTIPLLSQGELGLMSMQLNRLLEYMHQREDIENMLKRVVSPDIMEKLISTDTEKLKRGEEREMAVLFCDIRGFTQMSEGASASEIIFFLNSFFSELADIVARHHGTVNKFMGDAILAVYSAEHPTEAVDAAMNSAVEISMRVRQMRLPNGASPQTGTGIHFGRVVAGTIGSQDRYEYTYLGDAVNTASRLQGLSKRFAYPVIVSEDAYRHLSDYLQAGLTDLGQHRVRGKTDAIHIYGGPN